MTAWTNQGAGPAIGGRAGGEALGDAERLLLRVGGVALFPLLIWLGANVSVPMGRFGVPFTLQTLAVVMSALCLGPRLGALAVGLYALMGVVGVPVFSGGNAGLGVILGQNGGYIVGFVLAQPVITGLIRRRDGSIRGWGAMVLGVLGGHLTVFVLGVPWLWLIRNWVGDEAVTWSEAWWDGFVIFVPGMLAKCAVGVWLGRVAAPWASRRIW